VKIKFNIESWTALAPGLNSEGDWVEWLGFPAVVSEPFEKPSLKKVPPLLRRRFNLVGRFAMGAILDLLDIGDTIPCVFASRHGDTMLTLDLLENMGRNEAMSPTNFSLAVHNAVSGLYTIAHKNTQPVTAIAATKDLTINALFEAISQCQHAERILCLIYDAPLPDLYQSYCSSEAFPYAIAMIINKNQGVPYEITYSEEAKISETLNRADTEFSPFLSLLIRQPSSMVFQCQASPYKITRVDTDATSQV